MKKKDGNCTLTSRTAASVVAFNADGRPVEIADRNGNTTSFTRATGTITKVTSTGDVTGAREASLA